MLIIMIFFFFFFLNHYLVLLVCLFRLRFAFHLSSPDTFLASLSMLMAHIEPIRTDWLLDCGLMARIQPIRTKLLLDCGRDCGQSVAVRGAGEEQVHKLGSVPKGHSGRHRHGPGPPLRLRCLQVTQCSLNSRSMFTQCSLNVHSMFTQRSLNVHSMFTQCSLSVH
jgi:hypothetical protein